MTDVLLPTSVKQQDNTATTAVDNESGPSLLGKIKEYQLGHLRSLREFFDINKINFTFSSQTIFQRWNHNLQYFATNYLLLLLCLGVYAIITNWTLVFTITFIIGGFYAISKVESSLTLFNMSITRSALCTGYVGASVIFLLFSGAVGAVFWVFGAGALVILSHAALLETGIEDIFADQV